jgi:two-component system phosphate regulon response regulator PhoB
LPGQSILVIEDDPDIRELIRTNLEREGYVVHGVETGEEGLRHAKSELPDLILLDLMLPGLDGLEVCRQLRAEEATSRLPVIMLTAKGEDADIVAGLEIGADEYVIKPFSPRVLVARIRARLRLQADRPAAEKAAFRRDGLYIDPSRHLVKVDGKPVSLTTTEFKLLSLLARNAGMVFSRYDIVNEVRGEDAIVTDRAVDAQMVGLRKKLGDRAIFIETVRGVGYRFREVQ